MKTKSIYILFLVLGMASVNLYCQSTDQNYIQTRNYTNEVGTTYLDQVQYFDGLGRPVQTVQKAITPGTDPSARKDLILLQEYDSFGRESNAWLPAAIAGNNGAYVNPASVKTQAIATNGSDQKPYSMPVYEASPLNRVMKQFGPGQEWHNAGNGNGKAVKISYLTNKGGASSVESDIKLQDDKTLGGIHPACNSISLLPGFHFQATSDKSLHLYIDPALCQQPSTKTTAMETSQTALRDEFLQCKKYQVINNSLKEEAHYDTGQLYVTLTMDEDDNQSLEFKDKLGQVVLTRQINNGQNYDTYYVYNDSGLKCFVLPPKIQDEGVSQAKLDELAYQYRYDNRNRCIAKKIPGSEWNYYIYDKADRLIFSQDGEQRDKGEWAFSIPDVFGRVVLTGTCANSLDYSANPLGSAVVTATRADGSNIFKGYATPAGVALSTPKILSVNYYDDYAFLGYNTIPNTPDTQYTTEAGYGVCYGDHQAVNRYRNKGLLTGTMTAQMNPDGTTGTTYLYSVMYYDNRGRLIQTKSNNHLTGGIEEEYIAYNFTGQPTQRKHIHSATGKNTQTEVYTYTYDHAGRLLKTTHQLNNGAVVTLAENTYDEVGRLKTNKKGGQDNLNTTYNYNVRSWTSDISSYHFNERLAYTYNGNISSMQWQQVGKWRTYDFTYDNLSRLKTAAYTGDGNFSTAYSYDKHGNMMTLQRYGLTDASTYGKIDELTMTYTGNQMKTVSDAAADIALNTSMDFKEYTKGTGVEYFYNRNGAMYKDLNKGISSISYNSLNLPRMVDIKNMNAEGRNEYTYSASGQKLRAVQRWNPNYNTAPVVGSDVNVSALTNSSTTDYAGNIIYENNTLKRILVDGGYYESGNYYFYVNDHLGNNRIVANATASVVQSTQYYPFGSSFADAMGGSVQPYKYNNKELDSRNGLNLYDNGARFYDSGVPLTLTPDPLAEKYYSMSPYSWVANNPMKFIDKDGRSYDFPPIGVDPAAYRQMAASKYVENQIKENSSTIQMNGILSVASMSDVNDAVVLGTTITRGTSGAVNVDGTPAGGIGVGFAVLGAVLPVVSGSAVKGFFKSIGKALGIGGDAGRVVNSVVKNVDTGSQETTTVYRAFGGDSRAQGYSWTPDNPQTINNFRDKAGLPSGGASGATNTADFMIKGTVNSKNIIEKRAALPLDGNKGGLLEYIINPLNVTITDFKVLKP